MPQILSIVPIMKVANLEAALDYYCNVLGFTKDGVYHPDSNAGVGYAFLSRDGMHIHISSFGGDGVFGIAVYFYVASVDALHEELRAAGAKLRYDPDAATQGPGDQPWGMREIYVEDLDGNVLRFGQRL